MNYIIKILVIFIVSISFLFGFNLKDGFELALKNDMEFETNRNNLKTIKLDQEIAESLLNSSIDFSATVEANKLTQDDLSFGSEPLSKTDEYKVELNKPLFDGFESKFEQKLQEERFKSAVYYLKQSKDNVALNYITAYVNTLREKDLLNLSKENLEITKKILNKVQKKVESGYGTKLEFEEARSNFAESKVNLNIQKINLKESIENLKLYVQTEFDTSELEKPDLDVNLPKNVKDAVEIAYRDNPAINVSKTNVNVAMFEQKKSEKNFYPNINFVSSYNINNALFKEKDEEYNNFKMGFQLTYNLYNGGKDRLEDKKALQNIQDKKLLVRKNEYEIKTALRLAWNNFNLINEKQENLKQYLLIKNDVLDATTKEFDLGLKDLNTLLDTHVEYIDIKKDLIKNSYDLFLEKCKIFNAMGKISDLLEDKLPILKKIDNTIVKDIQKESNYSFAKIDLFNENKIKKIQSNQVIRVNDLEQNKNYTFKEKFLNANGDKYTINLAYTKSENRAKAIIEKFGISKNAFYFTFGSKEPLQKIMYGVFSTKNEALKSLELLPNGLKRNKPRIEKVSIKQKLFHKYNKDYFSNLGSI